MRIRELREEQHMTQVRLSVELGVSQETISAYEKGKHLPSVAALIQLSKIFNVSCDYILGLSDDRSAVNIGLIDNSAQKLLAQYKRLSPDKREKLHAYIDGLMDGAD